MDTLNKNEEKILIFSMGIFIAVCVLAIWLLWRNSLVLTLVLFFLAFMQLAIIKSKKLIAVFILASIGGGIIESVAIFLGGWKYAMPNFFNIPLWLMPAWGSAAIIIVSLYKLFGKIKFFQKD